MIDETNLVVQSNPLVQAQYKLGETEQKLLRVLVSMLGPHTEGLEKKYHRLSVQDFAKFLGHKDADKLHTEMRRIARRLKLAPVKVHLPNGDTIETSWIAGFRYPRGTGWIEFEISWMLEEQLLRVKEQFTAYYLANVAKLTGAYTVRIYELVRQYMGARQRRRTIDLDELKQTLGIGEEYAHTGNFLRRVIKPAHKEINVKTDVSFDWRVIKESRRIVAIEFFDIQTKVQIPPSIMTLIPKKYRESKRILATIRKYLELMGAEYVTEKLNYVASRAPANWADYLYTALENDYGAGFVPDQGELPGVPEAVDFIPGTVFELNGERYTFDGNGLQIGGAHMPIGQMKRQLKAGKLRIVEEKRPRP